jgi:hypothetical protein
MRYGKTFSRGNKFIFPDLFKLVLSRNHEIQPHILLLNIKKNKKVQICYINLFFWWFPSVAMLPGV